jgi:Mrp family chromosome partitioning ATPase
MIFNHKIERPHVIKRQMQLPLMLSIPLIQKRSRLLEEKQNSIKRIPSSDHERTPSDDKDNTTRRAHDTETIDSDFIMPYAEAVRDRIVFSFKLNQVTHKPKILAVTGMTSRAGTSTIAYGLAKSFAQIRGIKVLLVNLSGSKNPPVGLEFSRQAINLNDALRAASDPNFRRNAKPLYHACDRVASPSGDDDVLSSLQLRELLPALQSSNYDYIIFDMPKAVETSRSLSMASLMDMVLLVLDAQNTSRSGLQWTYDELSGGRSNVSCIFNKVKTHGPSWLVDDV